LDIRLCSLVKINHCFQGTYCLHLQGWGVGQERNQHEAGSKYMYSKLHIERTGSRREFASNKLGHIGSPWQTEQITTLGLSRAFSCCQLYAGVMLGLLFDHEDERHLYVPLEHLLTFTRLHGAISQKTELFIVTIMRTLNPRNTA
jgi:hypothetical protein